MLWTVLKIRLSLKTLSEINSIQFNSIQFNSIQFNSIDSATLSRFGDFYLLDANRLEL